MGPKPPEAQCGELFRQPLIEQINGRHPLVRLAAVIDWQEIERSFGKADALSLDFIPFFVT